MEPSTSTTKDAPSLAGQVKAAGGAVTAAADVAVSMVKPGSDRDATAEETRLHERSVAFRSKKLFNVHEFSPDLDADGKVSREEEEVYGWLKGTADSQGDVHPTALYNLLGKFAKQRRAKRDLVKALAVALIVIVILVVTQFGVSWGVAARFLNADKKEAAGGTVLFVGDNIVGSRVATQHVPLIAAPAMTIERLAEVKTVTVTFNAGGPPPDTFDVVAPAILTEVQRAYGILGATLVSPTEMYFDTNAPGTAVQRIHIKDGFATVVATKDGVEQWRLPACEANAECAALLVDTEEEAAELMKAAVAALVAAGHLAEGETPGDTDACHICHTTSAAYDGCAEADKANATAGTDASPACFVLVAEELGFAQATCGSRTRASRGCPAPLLPPSHPRPGE
jgi:hypothetical protein